MTTTQKIKDKFLGRFSIIEPTKNDKEAIKNKNLILNPINFPKEVIGDGIINTTALYQNTKKDK